MNFYDKNVEIVMGTLEHYRYGPWNIRRSKKCYMQLKTHFENSGCIVFDLHSALEWCSTVCSSRKGQYTLAVYRLGDVYDKGHVLSSHLSLYGKLSVESENAVDEYIGSLSSRGYADRHLEVLRRKCSLFFRFAEINGCFSLEEINFSLLDEYHQFIQESEQHYKDYEFALIPMLKYYAGKGACKIGYALYFRYAKFGKCTSMANISPQGIEEIETQRKESLGFPAYDFYISITALLELLEKSGYSKTVLRSVKYHLRVLCVFLDREGLGYNRPIADIWASEVAEQLFGESMVPSVYRAFDFFDAYCNGDNAPVQCRRNTPCVFDSLPEWCKHEIREFTDLKKKEGLAPSTIKHYTQYCSAFCLFLQKEGLGSFEDLLPATVKKFNVCNIHSSPRGKNSYNSAIRFFLIYLEINGIVAPGIHYALPCCYAGGEKIVEVLSDDDRKKIEAYCDNAKTPIELRDAAILRIGMDTALRSSDIVALKKSDIDWKNRCIRCTQSKTGREHIHPVGVRTLNAIFQYRRDGTPPKAAPSDFIFISSLAPYKPVTTVVCRGALERAGCSTTRFHNIRRTYATDTLKSGATVEETAELLGHSNTASVHRYTSLNEDKMRLCPLSLSDTGLQLNGRYVHG